MSFQKAKIILTVKENPIGLIKNHLHTPFPPAHGFS
jgi:hypothetical protein